MISIDFSKKLTGPWLICSVEPVFKRDVTEGVLFLEFDASEMTNLDGLYRQLTHILMFPEYFGRNFNALDECITDLEWLPANSYLLYIDNADDLLTEESDDVLAGFISILEAAGAEWAKPVTDGEAWDRKGVPFHTIFKISNCNSSKFLSRVKRISGDHGVDYAKIQIFN